jgi:alpha-tubulin suppressor-like RCC1 family protein
MYGVWEFDTRAHEGRCVDLAGGPGGGNLGVLLSDGRVFVRGNTLETRINELPALAPGRRIVDFELGRDYALGRLDDGQIVSWGRTSAGWGSAVVPPLPAGMFYMSYGCGTNHALLVRSDGVIVPVHATVGGSANSHGQANTPTLPPGRWATKVGGGDAFSVAMLDDGSIFCWGDNSLGQCAVPPLPSGVVFTDFDCGDAFTLAMRSDGELVGWGNNIVGQCNPPQLPSGVRYELFACGLNLAAAWRSDGRFEVWGTPYHQQAWDFPAVPLGAQCVEIAASRNGFLARFDDGSHVGWASEFTYSTHIPSLQAQGEGVRHEQIGNGWAHALLLYSNGRVDAFGEPDAGQCEVPALPDHLRYTRVSAGVLHSAAVRSDGALIVWGDPQLSIVPPLPTGVVYTDVAADYGHTVALRSDGTAVAFGVNHFGQTNIPALPSGMAYVSIDAAGNRTLLLRSDGQVVVLGSHSSPAMLTPPPLPSGLVYNHAAIGINLGAAVRSDGSYVTWGRDFTTPNLGNYLPPPLPFGVYYVGVDCGQGFGLLRRSDGQVDLAGYISYHWFQRHFVPPPGQSYREARSYEFHEVFTRLGAESTYVSYANGCAGSRPTARLIPRDTPYVGGTFEVTVFDLPQSVGFLMMSFAGRSAALPLAGYGMPNCTSYVAPDAVQLLLGANQQAEARLPIPDLPALVGLRFQQQALVLDPQAGNAAGAVVSNAAEGVIGYR